MRTSSVNAYALNHCGLHNVAGNAWEWCADWFSPDRHATDAYDPHDPTGLGVGDERLMRVGFRLFTVRGATAIGSPQVPRTRPAVLRAM